MKDTQRGQIKAQGTIQGRISSHIADEVHCTERLDEMSHQDADIARIVKLKTAPATRLHLFGLHQ